MSNPTFLDKAKRDENELKGLRRNAILIVLEKLMPTRVILDTLLQGVQARGVNISEEDLTKDLSYWINMGFVRADDGSVAAVGITHYSITDKGQQYLEKIGLA